MSHTQPTHFLSPAPLLLSCVLHSFAGADSAGYYADEPVASDDDSDASFLSTGTSVRSPPVRSNAPMLVRVTPSPGGDGGAVTGASVPPVISPAGLSSPARGLSPMSPGRCDCDIPSHLLSVCLFAFRPFLCWFFVCFVCVLLWFLPCLLLWSKHSQEQIDIVFLASHCFNIGTLHSYPPRRRGLSPLSPARGISPLRRLKSPSLGSIAEEAHALSSASSSSLPRAVLMLTPNRRSNQKKG
jgi:hypothetical protein